MELSTRSIHHNWSNHVWIQHPDPDQLLSVLWWKNQVQGTQEETEKMSWPGNSLINVEKIIETILKIG